jgi:23S rRNA (pseudouridine1915-N3)-methyltransferase
MRISVYAVGRMKAGPEKELADRYFERFARSGPAIGLEFDGVSEFPESRAQSADERRRDEARRVRAQLPESAALVLLDERGKSLSSEGLAQRIASFRDGGKRDLVFAIGGPDGHDHDMRDSAALALAFGAQTWPHQLVRIMLAEQLYRVATILTGHPYHRA